MPVGDSSRALCLKYLDKKSISVKWCCCGSDPPLVPSAAAARAGAVLAAAAHTALVVDADLVFLAALCVVLFERQELAFV